MQDYSFTAKEHSTGRTVKGSVQADGESAAVKLLSEKNLFVTHLEPKREGINFGKFHIGGIRGKDKVLFTRQLSTLVHAGLPITQALNTAVDQVDNKQFRAILDKIKANVEGGQTLAGSFAQYPNEFSRTFISLINAGEQSGTLDKTLARLADQMEKEQSIKTKIRGAMIYPAVILVVIVGVVIFMLVTVVPQIKSLYESLGKTLPIFTRVLLGVSTFLQHYWWLALIVLIAVIVGIRAYIRTPRGRYQLDLLKLKIPAIGGLFQKVYMARFTSTLGVLVISGVPILEALSISADAVGNEVVKNEIVKAADEVKGGKALSAALVKRPYMTSLVPQMIRIGEDSGTLGDMLDKVATYYQDEVDNTIRNLSTLIEPFMIIIMGTLVGVIIMAVLYPIYSLVGSGLSNIGNVQSSTQNSTGK